jgi:glycosyltransferase involved in cell wall biosynthesis
MTPLNNFLEGAEILGSGLHKRYELLVVILSFNQVQFLQQAIESVLNQKWSQGWHIIIHDDASVDNSSKLIREFFYNQSNRMTVILQKTNRYSSGFNIPIEIQNLVSTNYIARLDGDDFFISRDKLIKHVAILNADSGVSLVSHSYEIYDGQSRLIKKIRLRNDQSISNYQLLAGNPIATPTAMYRASSVHPLPSKFTSSRIQDWPLWVILGSRGRISYDSDTLSGYRIHDSNGFALRSNQDFKRDNLLLHEMLSRFLSPPWGIYWGLLLRVIKVSFKMDKITGGLSTKFVNKTRSKLMGYHEL